MCWVLHVFGQTVKTESQRYIWYNSCGFAAIYIYMYVFIYIYVLNVFSEYLLDGDP